MKKFAKALLNTLPRGLQRRLRDRPEDVRRRRPGRQVYPRGTNFDGCLREGIAGELEGLVIRNETPVASIGSCFADGSATQMRERGFNYVAAESDVFHDIFASVHSRVSRSARGRRGRGETRNGAALR